MSERLLVLGTSNVKKRQELSELFAPTGLKLLTLEDFSNAIEVEETGQTFAANAALKARQQACHLNRWVLAEDSGLMVDVLDGAPGVFSARYSGDNATDDSNNQRLLADLGQTPIEKRTAAYCCHMTLADPNGTIAVESEAFCRGRITFQPRGSNGFGYDPLFEVIECHKTFGLLGSVVKAAISHRARAARQMLPSLIRLIDSGRWD